jgi:hypothetical protein
VGPTALWADTANNIISTIFGIGTSLCVGNASYQLLKAVRTMTGCLYDMSQISLGKM